MIITNEQIDSARSGDVDGSPEDATTYQDLA